MTLDYFYGQAGELFSFYRIPKALFQEPRFQNLSTDAKTLYGILLDRMSLSAKNGWLDEQGRVFIIFTIEDVKRALCCADNKATKLLRELEKFGLIERKRRGLGKPSLVYVKNFSAESSKSIFQNRDFHDSGGFKSASQDPAKSRCNKTDENNTEKSETYALMKNKIIGVCPNCGANVVEREKGWFCENRECRFVLWKDNAFFKRLGKRLDAHVADKLLRDGRVRLKDCKSAKGKTYNATVLLGTEPDGRSKFSLEFEGGC